MPLKIKDIWNEAYEAAAFYKSEQNTAEYWNRVAQNGSAGLEGSGHIELLLEMLEGLEAFAEKPTAIDIGCGTGEYVVSLAEKCASVIALDNAGEMIQKCKAKCQAKNLENVEFLECDFLKLGKNQKYDIVLACLNPATYFPGGFEKLLDLSNRFVVYMSMNIPIRSPDSEPVYAGTNSVGFPEQYMEELGIKTIRKNFKYTLKMPDGTERTVPFAYLICDKQQ